MPAQDQCHAVRTLVTIQVREKPPTSFATGVTENTEENQPPELSVFSVTSVADVFEFAFGTESTRTLLYIRRVHSLGLPILRLAFRPYLALAGALTAGAAGAQTYPIKPVRIIVPNAPSGLADVSARIIAAKLSEALGQQFIVENRVGAGSTIGTAAAARATADGYTLLVVFDSHASNPHLFKNLDYNTLNEFAPVAQIARGTMVLVVNPGVPAKSVRDVIQLAKSKPGAITFASVGPGSPARLLLEWFKLKTGVNVVNVPYKGAGNAIIELISGQVDAMFLTPSSTTGHTRSGRLRAIAVTSEKGAAMFPGVAQVSDTLPNFRAETWSGLLAPVKVAPDIIARLNAECLKLLAQPDVMSRFNDLALEAAPGTPAQFGQWIRAESERWGRVIRAQKIVLE